MRIFAVNKVAIMAVILNIETSTEVCSVNISRHGQLIAERESSEGMNHSRLLTIYIDELLHETGYPASALDAVAISKGPGSYTGLRIGVSVAKGLCYSLDIPMIAVGTLDAAGKFAAENHKEFLPGGVQQMEPLFCPMIDARRMEVYTAFYNIRGEIVEPVSAKVIDENSFRGLLQNHRILFFGNGAEKCRPALIHPNALFTGPDKASARFMIKYTEEKYNNHKWEDVAYFEPYYLKEFIATVPRKS
jgi:tRNA threonylcarbamoyladenosine biosynthesis protein TsaB